jgi:hypothetical protein
VALTPPQRRRFATNFGQPVIKPQLIKISILLALLSSGCSREHYRVRADRDSYAAIVQKSVATPWQTPSGFTVYPDPASRMKTPGCHDDPCLPDPSPKLYAYQLPIFENVRMIARRTIPRSGRSNPEPEEAGHDQSDSPGGMEKYSERMPTKDV